MTEPAPPVVPGEIVDGKYRVVRELGRGAMGVVVAAEHVLIGGQFAIKFLLPEALKNRDLVERFAREGQAVARIRSQHVVRVSDVGRLPNGAPFLVMEHLEGTPLDEVLVKRRFLEPGEAIEYLLQACEAIAEAHTLGIVHRDLKPANLFVATGTDGRPLVKVLDFGIAKSPFGESKSMTSTSAVLGSPYYMSPEQIQSTKNVDPRSDVWSLGVILHQCLTGGMPFEGENVGGLVANILMSDPTPLRAVVPRAPEGLERVILDCLRREPNARVQSVGEFAARLDPWALAVSKPRIARIQRVLALEATGQQRARASAGADGLDTGRAVSLRAPDVASSSSQSNSSSQSSVSSSVRARPKRGRTGLVAGVALVALVGGAAAAVSIARASRPAHQPVEATATTATAATVAVPQSAETDRGVVATATATATAAPDETAAPTASVAPTAATTTKAAGPAPAKTSAPRPPPTGGVTACKTRLCK